MFHSIAELTKAMFDFLNCLKNDGDINALVANYRGRSLDFVEMVTICLSKEYVTSVSCAVGAHDDVILNLPNPHVTPEGELFVQQYN